jgi:ABC-type amino acid transport substrate-binding protein
MLKPNPWHAPILWSLAAIIALACNGQKPASAPPEPNALQQIKRDRKVRAGWAPYAPYASRDPASGKVQGFYIDLFNRVAEEAKLEVEWVETTWPTMIADLGAGKFQVMAAPVFRTIPRSLEVAFSRPIDYFGYSAIVRAGDPRFKTLADFDKPDVKISVTQGEVGHEYVVRHLPKAVRIEHRSGDIALALVDVIESRADVGICDAWTAKQFAKQHAGKVVDLFGDNPFYNVGAGWFVRADELQLLRFLDSAIDWLESSGTLAEIAVGYELPSRTRGPASR